MLAALLLTSVIGQWSPDVLAYETKSGREMFVLREAAEYETKTTAYTSTGCFCAMCLGNGSSGYRSSTYCVNAPTPASELERTFRSVGLGEDDILLDAGCGDGRACILATLEFGARSVGLDTRAEAVELAQANARRSGVSGQTRFYEVDATRANLSQATVLYAYLPPDVLERLAVAVRRYRVPLAISYKHPWPRDAQAARRGDFYLWELDADRRGWSRESDDRASSAYAYRVWSASWCKACQNPAWKATVERLEGVAGVQRLDFDRYRQWCSENGIGSVPTVQVFRLDGDEAVEVARLTGVQSWQQLVDATKER